MTTVTPLIKSVTVPADPGRAFALFTAHMAAWWPLATHSVGEEAATGVTLDGRVGGRIVETVADGRSNTWGTVTDWDPPHRVAFTWHPGHGEEHATHVEVRFFADGRKTRVELVHTGWERHPRAGEARTGYDTGWDLVLCEYVRHAQK